MLNNVTKEELLSLLKSHLSIVDGEICNIEHVANYLLREFERQEEDFVKRLNNKLEVCLN